MSLILSIETATSVCSVALHQEGQLLGEYKLLKDKSHSGKLAVLIAELISNAGFSTTDLDAVAISEGPGSYTGLRIGTSTAKGLCYGLEIPLIAVDSLTALAAQAAPVIQYNDLLIPMFDARRMEVYAQVLDSHLNILVPTKPEIINEGSFGNFLENHNVYALGDGAEKCKEVIMHPGIKFLNDIYPSASSVGKLAHQKFMSDDFVDVAYFEPFYLKEYKAGVPKPLI